MTTEFEFTLPRGFVDKNGTVHQKGIMRLATASDEILPLKDHRVQGNIAYMHVIILARVVTRLGDLSNIDTRIIENLYTADFNYLKNFYNRINELENPNYKTSCPHCDGELEIPLDFFFDNSSF